MKFGNFLFPSSLTPDDDGRVIRESLEEARLCDDLGMDMLWLAEHHFDGICAYVDPVSFAGAVLGATSQITVGFAVAQMSLHHPVRMAEQMAMLDNLSQGRIVVGLGRGTAYNIYDYQGYGIDPDEAYERLLEAEAIMLKAWTTPNLVHEGRFWQLRIPQLRPRSYTRPHPPIIRACSGEESMLGQAREGRPFLMNVQSNEVTAERMRKYRETMLASGHDEAAVERNVSRTWVWRNIFVAETDSEAERIAVPRFQEQLAHRKQMRERIYREQGVRMKAESAGAPARATTQHALLCGSPATVAEAISEIDDIGVGGLILQFRLGAMPHEEATASIRLFMDQVASEFTPRRAA